jgi:hypothetical protein
MMMLLLMMMTMRVVMAMVRPNGQNFQTLNPYDS